jgi:MoaA/NifB/PqqE/SkfB family radical SAM enzyme
MTTNGLLLDKYGERLKVFREINISVHERSYETLAGSLEKLRGWGIPRGIHYVVSKRYADSFQDLVEIAKKFDALLLFLTYKPVVGDIEQQVPPLEVMALAQKAHAIGCKAAVDGLTCARCMMKVRFVDIGSQGEVHPCSFVRKSMGNLQESSFEDIWKGRGEQEECPYGLPPSA